MGRPTTTRTIDGYEVSTTRLAPTKALKLAPKLLKLLVPALDLAPVVLPIVRAAQSGVVVTPALVLAALGRFEMSDLTGAVVKLLGQLDDATIDMLCRELLCDTSIILPNDNGVMSVHELNTQQMVDIAFGRVDEGLTLLVEVLLFVGEVNFKKHFLDVIGRLGPKTKPTSSSEKPAA
jgi:hypothetical protein